VPSAATFTVWDPVPPITFKVNLLSGGIDNVQSRSSLLRRTFPDSRRPQLGALLTNRG